MSCVGNFMFHFLVPLINSLTKGGVYLLSKKFPQKISTVDHLGTGERCKAWKGKPDTTWLLLIPETTLWGSILSAVGVGDDHYMEVFRKIK